MSLSGEICSIVIIGVSIPYYVYHHYDDTYYILTQYYMYHHYDVTYFIFIIMMVHIIIMMIHHNDDTYNIKYVFYKILILYSSLLKIHIIYVSL